VDNFDRDAEALVKRYKKSELAGIIARLTRNEQAERDRRRGERNTVTKIENECEALRDELGKLRSIAEAVRRVMKEREADIDSRQLSLLLHECESGCVDAYKEERAAKIARTHAGGDPAVENAAKILMTLLDAVAAGEDPWGEGPSYDDLRDMVEIALCDRAEMLAKLGLTDREWAARGGTCESDFDL